jgi:hypothetical protein
MNRIQLEHIIRAASQIADDAEIVVIGSQAIHAQGAKLPPIAFQSAEAGVFPRNHPERADDIDAAIGELSVFHGTHGYYAHGVSPNTAILPTGWEERLIRVASPNTGGATGLCLDVHDLLLSKYVAGREKDLQFNRALVRCGCATKRRLLSLVSALPVDHMTKRLVEARIIADFADANQKRPRESESP